MAISQLSDSGFNGTKYGDIMAGNTWMEPIATTLVGSGGSASVTFSSIPQTYTHLQIRGLLGNNNAGSGLGSFYVQLNGDTGSNYAWHRLYGNGASALTGSVASTTAMDLALVGFAGNTNPFAGFVLDILDYTNQNKYKTCRTLSGGDRNGAGTVALYSGLWMNTSPITSIKFTTDSGNSFTQYSRFSLYGLRG